MNVKKDIDTKKEIDTQHEINSQFIKLLNNCR